MKRIVLILSLLLLTLVVACAPTPEVVDEPAPEPAAPEEPSVQEAEESAEGDEAEQTEAEEIVEQLVQPQRTTATKWVTDISCDATGLHFSWNNVESREVSKDDIAFFLNDIPTEVECEFDSLPAKHTSPCSVREGILNGRQNFIRVLDDEGMTSAIGAFCN